MNNFRATETKTYWPRSKWQKSQKRKSRKEKITSERTSNKEAESKIHKRDIERKVTNKKVSNRKSQKKSQKRGVAQKFKRESQIETNSHRTTNTEKGETHRKTRFIERASWWWGVTFHVCIILLNCPTSIFEKVSDKKLFFSIVNASPKPDGYSAHGKMRGDKLLWFVVRWKWTGNGRAWACWKTSRIEPRYENTENKEYMKRTRAKVSSNNTIVSVRTFYRQILSNSLFRTILVGSCRYLDSETSAPGSPRYYLLLAHDFTWMSTEKLGKKKTKLLYFEWSPPWHFKTATCVRWG